MNIRLKPEKENQILRKITQTISCNLNLEEVLKQIVEMVIQVTKGDACLLYLLNDKKEELTLRASKNPHPKILGKIKIKVGEGITGWVAKERKPVAISKNASDDPRFKFFHNLPEDKYDSFLSVPIISRNVIIGVINVQHKRSHTHSSNEIALLSTVAQQVGFAIENARLYEETKKITVQIETLAEVSKAIVSNRYLKEILHLVVTMTAEMMNSKICSIMLLDEKKQELTIEATQSNIEEYIKKAPLKVSESISGKAVREKKPITVLDVTKEPGYKYQQLAKKEGICSMLVLPMMVKEKAIGVINIYTAVEHRFTEDEIKILQSVANQAAVAIENTKLMEETLAAKEALEIRKLVERAKGILMKETGMDEDKAYRIIHKKSMDSCKPMKEIAEAIILSSEIKTKI
ncbi:MAG: GAF domain-containing protein [Elusimicrobia bacterium]|nr:GAF domain-containing protein [Elusimicrobiota bacterium]